MSKSQELRSTWQALVKEAKTIQETAEKENRDVSADESSKFDELMASADATKLKISAAERQEKLEHAEAELQASQPRKFTAPAVVQHRSGTLKTITPDHINKAWSAWALGHKNANPDQMFVADEFGIDYRTNALPMAKLVEMGKHLETRSMSTTSSTAGLYLTPIEMTNQVDIALKYYCPIMDYIDVFQTDGGAAFNWPLWDDTQNSAGVVSQLGASTTDIGATTNDPVIANAGGASQSAGSFSSQRYSSDVLTVTLQQLQDSVVPIADILAQQMGIRIARKKEADTINGTGSSAPTGMAVAATGTLQLGSGNTLSYSGLVNFELTLDKAYRDLPDACIAMHDKTFGQIRQLVDSNGRPLINFLTPLNVGAGNGPVVYRLFDRYPVIITNQLGDITNGSLASGTPLMVFGSFKKFKWRQVRNSLVFYRYEELYRASYGAIGFELSERGWCNLAHYQTNVPCLVAMTSH